MAVSPSFSSGAYWEARYHGGGASGAGSLGRLACFKAAVINRFIAENRIQSLIDLGCGDASQLALLETEAAYVGVDVSPTALARCAARHPGRCFVTPEGLRLLPPAELTISLDVLYHLIEDDVFLDTTHTLFNWATRLSVPTRLRHLPPGSLDPEVLKDRLSHAHARHRNPCRGGCSLERRP